MRLLVLLSLAALSAAEIEFPEEWHIWKAEHTKVYKDEREELQRHIVWLSNKEYVEQHNKRADIFGYTLKMNKFGDLTASEFTEGYQCVQEMGTQNITELNHKYGEIFQQYKAPHSGLPQTIDWRTKGAVTSVKDQLRCGCSYAFAAIAALEGAHSLAYDSLSYLSQQNIVDCSVAYGNRGCSCGEVDKAYLYVIHNDGVDLASAYPYQAQQTECSYNKNYRGATATSVVTVSSGDEYSLQAAVASVGPVSVYVDASHSSFQFYYGGILDNPYCSTTKLSHAMVIIGYGTYNGKDYWLLKNSWGPHWGEYGYAKMVRNRYNQCGIATAASFPTL